MSQHLQDQRTNAWTFDAVPDMYPRYYEKTNVESEDCEDYIKSTAIFEVYQISASVASEELKPSGGRTSKSPKKRARDDNNDVLPSKSPSRPKKLRRMAQTTTTGKARRSSRISGAVSTSVHGRSPDDGSPASSSSKRSPSTSPIDISGVRRSSRLATTSAPHYSTHASPLSKRTRRRTVR